MKLEHAKLGSVELAEPITQRQVEAFFREKRELDGENAVRLSVPEDHGSIVRACWKAGILLGEQDVDALKPAFVRWIARELDRIIGEALAIPEA